MSEGGGRSATKDVAEGVRAILQRVADFFDILDLSFIVSGAVGLAALVFVYWRASCEASIVTLWRPSCKLPVLPDGWIAMVAVVIATYVVGLLCFIVGRWYRKGLHPARDKAEAESHFRQILTAHGLSGTKPALDYLARDQVDGSSRLYVRLWAELRHDSAFAESFFLLRRYWVLAAMFDGLFAALVLWAGVMLACAAGLLAPVLGPGAQVAIAVALLVLAGACKREAARYVNFQREELVASLAARHSDGRGS